MSKHGGKRSGAGRPKGALARRTKEVAERSFKTGQSPLEVMLDNMRHFQRVALDAEATLEGLTAAEFSTQMPKDASPEEQFRFLLATVKKTAGFRVMAHECAKDAAPYVHPKLASVEQTVKGGLTISQTVDRPPRETRAEWIERRKRETGLDVGTAAGTADRRH